MCCAVIKKNTNESWRMPALICGRECLLPVLRVRRGHGPGNVTHLERYAPPVTLWSWGARGGRDGRWGNGRGAEARGLGRQSFPADLRHRGAPFHVRRGLTHVLYCNNNNKRRGFMRVRVIFTVKRSPLGQLEALRRHHGTSDEGKHWLFNAHKTETLVLLNDAPDE